MDSDEPQQSAVGESAGQQLKRARERLNLSLTDIADAQHLRVSIIQAIEDGHYDQIDSELFLKGYVRAYARQVGADADALIKSLDVELEPLRKEREKQEQEDPLVDIERRRRKKRRLAKVLGIIVILGAIALAVWKLVLEPRMADGPPAIPEQSETTDSPAVGESENGFDGVDSNDELNSAEPDSAKTDSAKTDSAEPEAEQNVALLGNSETTANSELSDNPEPVNEPEIVSSPEAMNRTEPVNDPVLVANPSDDTSSEEPVNIEPVTAEPAAQPDPVFAESAQPAAVASPVRLEMSFVSDCWVQVTDASGARLVASLQRNGDQISVSGRPPLNVVIGAVDAVDTATFAGEPLNLSEFRVFNNRTEFTLTL